MERLPDETLRQLPPLPRGEDVGSTREFPAFTKKQMIDFAREAINAERARVRSTSLRALADDAFVVLNWARRLGFDRERQIAELVKTFEVRLGYREAVNAGAAVHDCAGL